MSALTLTFDVIDGLFTAVHTCVHTLPMTLPLSSKVFYPQWICPRQDHHRNPRLQDENNDS